VPSKWIKEESGKFRCAWPGDKSISKKIKKAATPDPTWTDFSVKILKQFGITLKDN
jgi:hypothetical protein